MSPDHRFIAYTMYDKDKDSFTLMVRDLVTGTLCDKPRADRVSNISWAMDGKALVYIVTNEDRWPYRLVDLFSFCYAFFSLLHSTISLNFVCVGCFAALLDPARMMFSCWKNLMRIFI